MATITISAEEETFSSISNYFIDYYMNAANGDFVKLYLYLARLCSAGRPISVSDIADHLNCTEKDVCRGIKYWIRQDVLKLSYNNRRFPSLYTGKRRFLHPTPPSSCRPPSCSEESRSRSSCTQKEGLARRLEGESQPSLCVLSVVVRVPVLAGARHHQ